MKLQEKKIICVRNYNQMRVSVVDSMTLKDLNEHNILQINWDDGDVSTTFFPKTNEKAEAAFVFRKKGVISVKCLNEEIIRFNVV